MSGPAPGALTPTREWTIDGRPLRIFDGHLGNVADYVKGLSRAAFTRTEIARPDTAEYRHWATEIKIEALLRQPIYDITRRAALGFAGADYGYRPYRAYTNVASYGDMLFTHTDCLPEQRDLTALWYLCEQWEIEWGGETVFFDGNDEIACAVRPRPGRLVIFDGAIKHVGRPPNRICYAPRYTFAIKFERVAVSASA
jgi:SM-20-related protein